MDGIMTSKLFTTRQGTIFLGVIAAVIAAVALIVYLNQYRSSVDNTATSPVLVATSLIPKDTSGDVIGSSGLYKVSSIAKANIDTGAVVNPATLTADMVALKNIYPGQQFTAADFGPATNSLAEGLRQDQRAVTLPLELPQQVGGQIPAAGRVDVWMAQTTKSGKRIVRELMQNIYAFSASSGNVTLRATSQQAGSLIWASQYADKVWLVLRPTVGSTQANPPSINLGG